MEIQPSRGRINNGRIPMSVRCYGRFEKKRPRRWYVSNAHSGWQSNDTDNRPIWHKLYRIVQDKFNHEVLPFHNVNTEKFKYQWVICGMNINTPEWCME